MTEKLESGNQMIQEVETHIIDGPIKLTVEEPTLDIAALETQAGYLRASLVEIDYSSVHGTCGDERYRIGLASGAEKVEARPSVFGGPDIHGLYVSEGAGVYKDSQLTPTERLGDVMKTLKPNGVKSGGHEHCAAAAGFGDAVIPNIVANPDLVRAYAKNNMDNYDDTVMTEVLENFTLALETYKGWDGEAALKENLGDEAGEAIEKLADVPHEGRTLARNKRVGYTIDQTLVHENADGEDSFEYDDPYADVIENALATSPDSTDLLKLMRHAREAVLVGVALSVPNTEIHQIDVR